MNEMLTRQGADQSAALVGATRALAPSLAARAADAERRRRVPEETVRDYEGARLPAVWIPRVYSGLELDLHTGLETMYEAARGCASSAWCLGIWQQHSWIVSMFPEAAQQETLAADENFHIGAVLAPRGTARRVDGGFRLSGFWPFASGCEHGRWIMLGAFITDDEGAMAPVEPPDREIFGIPAQNARLLLLPVDTVTIKGDWNAAGLAGTGSHSVVVDDVFVPDHMTLVMADAVAGDAPGRTVHDGPLYQATYYSFLHTALAGPAPGVAQGAVDTLLKAIDGKLLMPQNRLQTDMARTHRQIGEAEANIHAARLLLRDSCDRIMEAAHEGRQLDQMERAICRRSNSQAVDLCYQATELVFFAGGGSALAAGNPIQRAMRDMHGVKAHYFMDLETANELSGLARLGKTPFTYVF